MITTREVAGKNLPAHKNIEVTGQTIEELLEFCLPRIRSNSQEFYKKNIREELTQKRETIIDCHAGMSIFYTLILLPA